MIGHWIEMPTDKSLRPGGCLTFFFINCALLSRFTANFCQLQCSLSAKMWVWSFVLRGMMQPSCNTKQIMLLATEVFLVPFFKRISFYIVEFHFFNSMHPRSIFYYFFSCSVHDKVALRQTPSQLQVEIVTQLQCVNKKRFVLLVLLYVFIIFSLIICLSRSLKTYDMHNL